MPSLVRMSRWAVLSSVRLLALGLTRSGGSWVLAPS